MDLRRQAPNLLSGLRLALVPALLALAWSGRPVAFLCLFAFSLSTDLVDGYLARRWKASSEVGAKLDSWGDLATYAVFPLCAWWLFRDKMLAQLGFVAAGLIAFVAPTLIGLAKYRRITSYHTRAAKLVAIVMGAGLLLFLGFDVPWLFQAAVVLLLISAIEEIAITAVLPEWRANVPSFFSALRIARGAAPALALALLGFPVPAAAQLPDLVPEASDLRIEFNQSVAGGDVVEGCAGATTGRDLVRMSLTTKNEGDGPEDLGNPMCPDCSNPNNANQPCGNPAFVCSPAGGHNHPHYQNFLRYELVDPNDVVVSTGGKRSFCLRENPGVPGCVAAHSCQDQGLNPHCEDTYFYSLGCQYVDVTDVRDGLYSLRMTVDPLGQITESNEDNNVVSLPVVLSRGPTDDVELEGSALALKHDKLLKVRTRAGEKQDLSGSANDPTIGGGTIYLSDLGGGATIGFPLHASGWRRVGKQSNPKGYRYKGTGADDDPCVVKITTKGVKASCKLSGEHGHFELPAQGELFFQVETGSFTRRYCATYGGETLRNDATAVKRKHAPAASCDLVE